MNKSNEDMSAGSDNNQDFEIDNTNEKITLQELKIVLPGDYIGEGFISGHGTYENLKDGQIYASMAGVVHQIDRVICVRPLR